MCVIAELDSLDSAVDVLGKRIDLCSESPDLVVAHLLEALALDHAASLLQTKGPRAVGTLFHTLRAFLPAAKTVVVEFDYFDLDYRSEFTATHETAFGLREASTDRVHFFGAKTGELLGLRRVVETLQRDYLGYVVLRPQSLSAVGRSVITDTGSAPFQRTANPISSPEPEVYGHLEGVALRRRVRTHVTEWNELFGVLLQARGVPFMQQDGHLLRCAHVSAWICHFTGVLRGRASRRASADFHAAEDGTGAYGRRYPSMGLTSQVLSGVLRTLALPPEVVERVHLETSGRRLSWRDRPSIWDAEWAVRPRECTECPTCAELTETAGTCVRRCRRCVVRLGRVVDRSTGLRQADAERADLRSIEIPSQSQRFTPAEQHWLEIGLREKFTSTICRYLNSGLPVILGVESSEHTRVVCGYLRKSDPLLDGERGTSEVGALILQDDLQAPMVIETVEDVLSAFADLPFSVIVPLPRGVWMSGEQAETFGAKYLETAMSPTGRLELGDDGLIATHLEVYEQFERTRTGVGADFAIRSFVTTGSDFKRGLGDRISSRVVIETAAHTRMSKYVWVVELIDRDARLRDNADGSVVATVVLDASFVTDALSSVPLGEPAAGIRSPVLFAHLPGRAVTYRPDKYRVLHHTPLQGGKGGYTHLYRSGRWGQDDGQGRTSPEAIAHASKHA